MESDGDDVDQVMVFAVAPGGTTPPRPVARDGAFEITGLDPGEVTLIATCPSGGSIGSREVITRAGERVTLGVWTLPACPADAPASR